MRHPNPLDTLRSITERLSRPITEAADTYDVSYIGGGTYTVTAPTPWIDKLLAALSKQFPKPRKSVAGARTTLYTKNEKAKKAAQEWLSAQGLSSQAKTSMGDSLQGGETLREGAAVAVTLRYAMGVAVSPEDDDDEAVKAAYAFLDKVEKRLRWTGVKARVVAELHAGTHGQPGEAEVRAVLSTEDMGAQALRDLVTAGKERLQEILRGETSSVRKHVLNDAEDPWTAEVLSPARARAAFLGVSEAKQPTYDEARAAFMAYLKTQGWTVIDGLKIPYAEHPDGGLRLWFKKQAIYYTTAKQHGEKEMRSFGNAHSAWVSDIRKMSPEATLKDINIPLLLAQEP